MSSGFIPFLLLLLLLLSTTTPFSAAAYRLRPPRIPIPRRHSPAIRAAYYPSWLFPTFPPSSIHPSYFTHVLYAFVNLDPTTSHLVITPSDASILTNLTATLHAHRPAVRVLLSIGGGGASPATFAAMAAFPSRRGAFISSSIAVARKYNLDGLDLDWEFPQTPAQMSDFRDLYAEWRDAVEQEAAAMTQRRPRLLLTAAVYFASHFFLSGVHRSYPGVAMGRDLDWVNAMCYDYHGGWDQSRTGLHAALYDSGSNVSTNYGIRSWLAAGMPARKVVMGLPLYGRTWRLKDPAEHLPGSPAVGLGPGSSDGTILYSAVVKFNTAKNATVVEDEAAVAAYSYAGTDWIGYDDPVSVGRKVGFARGLGLGGYFFWALGYDDSNWTVSRTAFITWAGRV